MLTVEAVLTIDLDALAANHAVVREAAGGAEVAPVVKADAYGLGVGPVARRLWAEDARSFFVARVGEGVTLRRALGPERPAVIYVLDGCPDGAAAGLDEAQLTPVLNSLPQIEAWAAFAVGAGRRLACALHVDTGLNRLGLRLEEAAALVASPDRLRPLDVALVISHLAWAEQPDQPLTDLQIARFDEARRLFPEARASLANSAGVFCGRDTLLEMVRPGISLYGGGPGGRADARFKTVATLRAPILQVRSVQPGESVGYCAAFTAERPMRVAVVAAGYADGVMRSFSPPDDGALRGGGTGGYGWLHGARRPILGRISMDLFALDVTECEARPGDLVELLGPNVNLDETAERAGTIAYELLTGIGARVRRDYVGAGA